jgi:hypothetical protein
MTETAQSSIGRNARTADFGTGRYRPPVIGHWTPAQRGQTRYFRMAALDVPDISYKVAEESGNIVLVTFNVD